MNKKNEQANLSCKDRSDFDCCNLTVDSLFGMSISTKDIEVLQKWSPSAGYALNRIPGIVAAADGSLLVYWEARTSKKNDTEPADIEVWRSADNGASFTKILTLGDQETTKYTNPVMVVDQEQTVHLLYTSKTGEDGVYHTVSKDHGQTWSAPINIIDAFQRDKIGWDMVNLGPGHGICLKAGAYKGRILFSAWCHTRTSYDVYTLYSDDNGITWRLGDRAEGNYNETAIAELSDSSVMLNSRQYGVPYDVPAHLFVHETRPASAAEAYRCITVSDTGIGGWSDMSMDTVLQNPAVQGSLCSTTVNGQHVLLYSGCDSKTARVNLSVRWSVDDGKTWSLPIQIVNQAAYSDLVVVNNTVCVIYESQPNQDLYLVAFPRRNP